MPLDHSATLPLLPQFSPAQTAAIIDATTDPDLSFRDIAQIHNISVETLALFLDRPDIKERLAKIDSSISSRTQSLANASLPSVVKALTRAVEVYLWEENHIAVSSPGPTGGGGRGSARPEGVSWLAHLEQRRRATETMRRAGWLLSRLTRPPAPPRPPRDPDRPSRAKTQGQQSLGSASADTRAPTPIPDHIDETSAPLAPAAQPRKPPSLAADTAILRQLAAGRQAAGRVLHAITGIAPPPEDPDQELEAELEAELDEVESVEAELDDTSDEYVDNLPDTYNGYLAHPMIPRAIKSLWKLFPIFRPIFQGRKGLSTDELPPDIYRPAFFFLLDSHTDNLPIQILPDNPLGDLARYLATTYPTRAGPAP